MLAAQDNSTNDADTENSEIIQCNCAFVHLLYMQEYRVFSSL